MGMDKWSIKTHEQRETERETERVEKITIIKDSFKRTLKTVKNDYGYFRCCVCNFNPYNIRKKMICVTDSRNDKYCGRCAKDILEHQIKKLTTMSNDITNKQILIGLSEDN